MSVHVLSWVLRNSPATLGDRLVLIVLADHADGDGRNSYPSVGTIAHEARLSERQARYCLRSLESTGQIMRTGRSVLRTNAYAVLMDGGNICPYVNGQGAILGTSGGQPTAPKPSLNRKSSIYIKERTTALAEFRCHCGSTFSALRQLVAHQGEHQ